MPTYGLSSTGFLAKSLDVIAAEIDTALKGILGASAGTEPDGSIPLRSLAGQIKTFLADAISSQWDLLQQVYSSLDPATASGDALDAIASITGTVRLGSRYSTVVATCVGTNGTVIAAGKVASVDTSLSRFDATAPGTIATVPGWALGTPYVLGNKITNLGNVYGCITAGTSAGIGIGPILTGTDITDGTVHWMYLGPGTAAVDILFQAEVAGPIGVFPAQLTTIATPVSGWDAVGNLFDAIQGALKETDRDLRIKREDEIAAPGNATEKAIQTAVLKSSTDINHPVLTCTAYHNDTGVTDINGVPPHSVEVIVNAPGTPDADIAQAILDSVAAGIGTYGTTTVSITDAAGNPVDINFSKVVAVPIYVSADVAYYANDFPADLTAGAKAIKDAIKTFGDTYPAGKSVRASALEASIFDGPTSSEAGAMPVLGVLDVTNLFISIAPSPTLPTTIVIGRKQIATFDVAHITITLAADLP